MMSRIARSGYFDCPKAARSRSDGAASIARPPASTSRRRIRTPVIVGSTIFLRDICVPFLDGVPSAGCRLALISHEVTLISRPNHTGSMGHFK